MAKVAIVTGGCRGIGLAISRRLAADGYQVVAVGRKEKSQVEEALSSIGHGVFYIQADVSDSADRVRIVGETLAAFPQIDLLVNNAGIAPRKRASILEMEEDSWNEVLDTNLKSNMFLTQLVARKMIENRPDRKRGTIINISSCSATVSSPNRAQYCVSKAGISMLTKLYADALAPYGIYVHEIRPGVIASDMTSTVKEKYSKLIEDGVFPIARWGEGEDVAAAVSLFASDELLYTTGNYIDVDGGFHIQRL